MRTFRSMSLTTLVMLTLSVIASWHVSYWIAEEFAGDRTSLLVICWTLSSLGIVSATT